MSDFIFIVEGSCGSYSDAREWPVRAFHDEREAERFAKACEAEAERVDHERGVLKRSEPDDPSDRDAYNQRWIARRRQKAAGLPETVTPEDSAYEAACALYDARQKAIASKYDPENSHGAAWEAPAYRVVSVEIGWPS